MESNHRPFRHYAKPMTESSEQKPREVKTGLCAGCAHARRIESSRGSVFLLCALSANDSHFPKYPRLPVLSCAGFSPRAEGKQQKESD